MSKDIEKWKVWRDTRGSRNGRGSLWEVSNFGHVRRNKKNYTLKLGNNGYLRFGCGDVHRAVAELFIPNIENKPEVDHIDRDKSNNHYKNLQWVTRSENMTNIDKEAWRKHMSESCKDKHHSEETKQKISKSLKGKPSPLIGRHHSEETKQKISKSLKGKHHTIESKQKMAEKRREYWQKRKEAV